MHFVESEHYFYLFFLARPVQIGTQKMVHILYTYRARADTEETGLGLFPGLLI